MRAPAPWQGAIALVLFEKVPTPQGGPPPNLGAARLWDGWSVADVVQQRANQTPPARTAIRAVDRRQLPAVILHTLSSQPLLRRKSQAGQLEGPVAISSARPCRGAAKVAWTERSKPPSTSTRSLWVCAKGVFSLLGASGTRMRAGQLLINYLALAVADLRGEVRRPLPPPCPASRASVSLGGGGGAPSCVVGVHLFRAMCFGRCVSGAFSKQR